MSTATALSLSEAAVRVGLHKASILRQLKSGRLSGTRDELGQWWIEPAELHWLYPPRDPATEATFAVLQDAATLAEARAALAEVKAQASLFEQRLADMRPMLDNRRSEREQAQAAMRQIADQREKASAEVATPIAEHRPWWRRLRATG
jgi:hypothetical protein